MQNAIVVAAFIQVGDEVLLTRRPLSAAVAPGLYHLPGGHVEFAEDPREALRRELREELNAEIEVHDPYDTFAYEAERGVYTTAIIYKASLIRQAPFHLKEDEVTSFAWVPVQLLDKYLKQDDPNYGAVLKGFGLRP